MNARLHAFKHFLGIPESGHQGNEKLVASLGGIISIALVLLVARMALGNNDALLIVPSMGASAVLIFAVPHSPLAQPWSVLVGHLCSAVVGVACYQWIPQPTLAAGCAVGLAIGAMHVTRSLHPPGGATALAAVIGGPALHNLGYGYAIHPIAINCVVILLAGIAFNWGFPWRRYPASLMRYKPHPGATGLGPRVSKEHLSSAMDSLNVVIDVNPDELRAIVQHALSIAQQELDAALPSVTLGRYYSNNKPGQQWSVRQIVDERRSDNPEADLVVYKVVEGSGLNRTGSCTRTEFARWVGRELQPTKTRG